MTVPIVLRTTNADGSTTGRLNLNDGTTYVCEAVDLGKPNRNETWIQVPGGDDILAKKWDSRIQMSVTLHIKPQATGALLESAVNAVRAEFDGYNYLRIDWGSGPKRFKTYPSALEPVLDGTRDTLYRAAALNMVVDWTFTLTRYPKVVGLSSLAVI